nr:CrcB family protein [Bacillus sp. B-jedd]
MALIAIGGFLGAICRLYFSTKMNNKKSIPFGTLIANFTGSFLLGYFAAKIAGGLIYAFLGIGFTGALTTFSTFTNELVSFWGRGKKREGLIYATASLLGGVILAFAGLLVGRS